MGNMIGNKKCEICRKNKATMFRSIAGRVYYICDSRKCNDTSLLRAGLLKKRDLKFNIDKDRETAK